MKTPLLAALALLLTALPAHALPAAGVQAEAREMFAKIVSYPSVAGTPAVGQLTDYLAGEFRKAGFAPADIEIVNADGHPGLIVTLRGKSKKPPILFLSHMDVVDAKREQWTSDPYTLTERDGALYGRGTVDNKYGLLTQAQAFIRLKREGFVPDRDLILAFSGDEEVDGISARALAQRLKGAAYALNSDAGGGSHGKDGSTSYAIQAGEKTYASFELTTRNPGGHSSRPRPDNAVYELARVLTRLETYRFPAHWNPVIVQGLQAQLPSLQGPMKEAVSAFIAAPSQQTADAIAAIDPAAFPELRTTCVATMLRGGIVENALANDATATVNCRILPGETVAETRATLARVAADEKLEIKPLGNPLESPLSDLPLEVRAALAKQLPPGTRITPYIEAGATDGLYFRSAGVPTVGVGPLIETEGGNYNYHGIDERVPLSEFNAGLDHYYRLAKALAGGK
ncbi:M20/M25/M40 family metallo-hydrolase [Sandaracinobacter neustonicus]|uniref:M20/M25/M40 family metallo-hydrolase n=1 Tax=Sandaracinobacter neustonicus TaxID=1715348 RepID=A0A501XK80_9SPHN|nr:M20/M25/M40 family metallo-hydrolase [Sandaracinobacter neustonicus]TPE60577.1 M20/M25/M40 family metallo-hydrolase [Sandaracinobacter neustonicus]